MIARAVLLGTAAGVVAIELIAGLRDYSRAVFFIDGIPVARFIVGSRALLLWGH